VTDRTPGPTRGPIRVIFNASAGTKGGILTNGATKADIEAVLDQVGVEAEVVESGSIDQTRRLTGEAVQGGYAAVVAAGGDGCSIRRRRSGCCPTGRS
jgi:diacylglycerol kinase family enzyme